MRMTRRQFLKASAALVAAPAIVKAENIMPIVPVREIETLGTVDVWVSDFGMLDVVKDATLYGQGMALVDENGVQRIDPRGVVGSMRRKPIKRRTAEEALEAALQDAWRRGGDPHQVRMSPELLDYFRKSKYA